jgi:hypothetical protein
MHPMIQTDADDDDGVLLAIAKSDRPLSAADLLNASAPSDTWGSASGVEAVARVQRALDRLERSGSITRVGKSDTYQILPAGLEKVKELQQLTLPDTPTDAEG